jgi:hypothetical protein
MLVVVAEVLIPHRRLVVLVVEEQVVALRLVQVQRELPISAEVVAEEQVVVLVAMVELVVPA